MAKNSFSAEKIANKQPNGRAFILKSIKNNTLFQYLFANSIIFVTFAPSYQD